MKVMVIGSGGREHALVWKIAQDSKVEKIFVAPGNGGTQEMERVENVAIGVKEAEKIAAFAKEQAVDLVVVPQDDALAAGVVDELHKNKILAFGATRAAAQIESSKDFAKRIMRRKGVPTADSAVFDNLGDAISTVRGCKMPIVIKADGLALGKGVQICQTVEEAIEALSDFMSRKIHGEAGSRVLIEEFLEGPEVSIHASCDGKNFSLWPSGRDHKPALEGDQGPNTGGMGTIAPVPEFTNSMMQEVGERIVGPVLQELARQGMPFVGCLYPGLKIPPTGLKVLEFNSRPGDPETQSYMRLLKTSLVDIMLACAQGKLDQCPIEWDRDLSAVCIVAASGGYPGSYKKGCTIRGIREAEQFEGVKVFHAGTKWEDGVLKTSGGRVLGVTAVANNLSNALHRAYLAMDKITFDGMQFRKDIGIKSLMTIPRL